MRRQSIGEKEIVNFMIMKSSEVEESNPFEARAWLLTGRSVIKNFSILYEAYQLEKRLGSVERAAYCFDQLFRLFSSHIQKDVVEMANAVRSCMLTSDKNHEQKFLYNIFTALAKEIQIEILIHCTEYTPVLSDKCQTMLLLVKLFPDTINQKNGGEMLFTLLSCESDAYSTFRKLLVVELVPSVLQLSKNLTASPRLISLLNQCIEFYVLVPTTDKMESYSDDERWDKLFQIVDQIGLILKWSIAPFFKAVTQSGSTNSIESLYQALQLGFAHRNHYSATELAYVTVTVFLRCIVAYYGLLRTGCSSKFGDKSKLILVEVFTPRPHHNARPDPKLPVLSTVSNTISLGVHQNQVVQHFLTAVKIWDMVMSLQGEQLEKEFFDILYSMTSLNLKHWDVFKEFTVDQRIYSGNWSSPMQMNRGATEGITNKIHHAYGSVFSLDSMHITNHLKLASIYCSFNNFKSAAECCIKGIVEALQNDGGPSTSLDFTKLANSKEDYSFFSPHIYNTDSKGNFIFQRRVHFLSENHGEILAFAANILIRCFHESVDVAATTKDERLDRCLGHLMTLLQIEWPSPPAEMIFAYILEVIRRNGSFKYFPFFCDFIIEPDFLETFMSIANHENKTVKLELFPVAAAASTSSGRRIGTRGVEKGSKTEFKTAMQRQMLKNSREHLETLISKFLALNKVDILTCFDY